MTDLSIAGVLALGDRIVNASARRDAARRPMCLGGGPRTAGADGRLTVCAGTTRGLKLPIKSGNSDEKASAIPLRTERYFAYTNNLISGYSISAITPMAEYHELGCLSAINSRYSSARLLSAPLVSPLPSAQQRSPATAPM
jgi:hypothetical protein